MLGYSYVHSVIEYQVLSDERDTTPALRMLCLLPAAEKERFWDRTVDCFANPFFSASCACALPTGDDISQCI